VYADNDTVPPTIPWSDFSSAAGVLGDAGYEEWVIGHMWHRYKSFLPQRQRQLIRTQAYFYLGYVYINFMPTKDQFSRIMYTPLTGAVSYTTFRTQIVPAMERMAAQLMEGGEIDWSRRLLPENHHELFPHYATTIVDCFPMVVQEPSDKEMHRLLNQGEASINYHYRLNKLSLSIN
jgi:hypothetical protein